MSDLLDVDQLADVHVVIAVADIRPYCLDHLSNHWDDDVPPGQRQRLAVEQLLQQRHHVAVIGRTKIEYIFWLLTVFGEVTLTCGTFFLLFLNN